MRADTRWMPIRCHIWGHRFKHYKGGSRSVTYYCTRLHCPAHYLVPR